MENPGSVEALIRLTICNTYVMLPATGSNANLPRPWRKELTKKGKRNCGDGSILGSSITGIWRLVPRIGQGYSNVPQHKRQGVTELQCL